MTELIIVIIILMKVIKDEKRNKRGRGWMLKLKVIAMRDIQPNEPILVLKKKNEALVEV